MDVDLFKLLNDKFGLLVFFVIGVGYLVGKDRVRGFGLGPTAGVLLAGLFFGHFGLKSHRDPLELGSVLFVYSVGPQAGPRLVNISFEQGTRGLVPALGVRPAALPGGYDVASAVKALSQGYAITWIFGRSWPFTNASGP